MNAADSPPVTRIALVMLSVCVSACASTEGQLRVRFAKANACPEDGVRVVEQGGDVYRASGCGKSTEYVCAAFAGGKDVVRGCEERGLRRQAQPEVPRFPERADRPVPPGPPR